jgi:hypothetical protein
VLRSLRSVVSEWAPVQGRALDPLVSVHGAWEGIVGKDVAHNARPQQLLSGTLIVTTASSAWSQQLAFLEPQILAALSALPENCRVARLRFRVGRVQPRTASAPTASRRPLPVPPRRLPEGPANPDVMERLRERLALRARSAAQLCAGCGVALDSAHAGTANDGERCAPCTFAERQRRVAQAQRLMYETPWLGFEAIAAQSGGLDERECEAIRRDLLRRWWEVLARAERTGRLRSDGFERRIASSYLLLQSGLPPDQVSRAAMRNLLGDRLEALLFGASEAPPGSRM